MMTEEMEIDFLQVPMRREEIYSLMGYQPQDQPDERISTLVESMLKELETVCRPRFGYVVYDGSIVSDISLTVHGVLFTPGKIITRYLDQASRYVLFLATAGHEFEAWLNAIKAENDIVRLFVADAIGSVLADTLAFVGVDRITARFEEAQMRTSNPYSPGYCGWHVREQKQLFSLLPDNFCGVKLTDSCLMLPIKSVSGLVAMGERVERKPYGCAICNMKTCYKRNLPKKDK